MNEKEKLVENLEKYNQAYREGNPLIPDEAYDRLVEKLREMDPEHEFLQTVEPEKFSAKIEVRHPVPMLSTEKAYSKGELARFVNRLQNEASRLGIEHVEFRMTPKLDGLAGRDDGKEFATRGNGEVGYEISSAFQKGVIPVGGRGRGLGEIVVLQSYFQEHLSGHFVHPRNMVVGIISSDKLNEYAKKALQDEAVHFVPYLELPHWTGRGDALLKNFQEISDDLFRQTDYPVDGLIVEVTDEDLKQHMGATAHHYRWQIAVKKRGETGRTHVESITWQIGRTGNVTPVIKVRPIFLSGAKIQRVAGHHAGLILEKKIGPGAEIEIIRSGEVIPKLEEVINPSDNVEVPKDCPVCGEELKWDNDFLKCSNRNCRDQIVQRIRHFFKTLGTADWFGIKTIEKLVDNGFDSLEKIYAMKKEDFIQVGFNKKKQAGNLVDAIQTSLTKPVEDWRLLAAFGIQDLGSGESRRFLTFFHIEELEQITLEEIEAIRGFGSITSRSIVKGIRESLDTINHMLSLGFNLIRTPLEKDRVIVESPISGKHIVFSGKMEAARSQMQENARKLGAIVQTSVTGKTDFLVCGEKIGASKISKAKKLGVKMITESEYYAMIR